MMIDKRLIHSVEESVAYIKKNVMFQWLSLVGNIVMIFSIASLFGLCLTGGLQPRRLAVTVLIAAAAAALRWVCTVKASRMSFLSAQAVKKVLRRRIYEKLLRLGASYQEQVSSSEAVQMAVEGVDQLETYFGAYLPQFFYAMLAPLTLFAVLCFVNVPAALVLLVCVPLIPVSIAAVQTFAKKLLSRYWGQYTVLGDTFLENLQGLTTLKIYQADEYKNEQMNRESENFRKITMKVLIMQLNSITVMDIVAYGGAALGMIMAVTQCRAGHIDLAGCLAIILLSADFFIPMRQLGSFFHIAMNGMAASDKIFRLLDAPEPEQGAQKLSGGLCGILVRDLRFSYEKDREVLRGIDMEIPAGSFIGIAGESGCGKSTVAGVLTGVNAGYKGSVTLGGIELSALNEASRMSAVTRIGHDSYLFKGTVRDNLKMGRPEASDAQLWDVLERTRLADFLRGENGLDTVLTERGANFSGGQRQRLALARALLHDSPVYIFDEATSNIDAESENDIMEEIRRLAGKKTVLLISHRLANLTETDRIYVMQKGLVEESGTHEELAAAGGLYARMWETQRNLEEFGCGRQEENFVKNPADNGANCPEKRLLKEQEGEVECQ